MERAMFKKIKFIFLLGLICLNNLFGCILFIPKIIKKKAFLLGTLAFVMGYYYIPIDEKMDIYKHYENYRELSLNEHLKLIKDFYMKLLVYFLKKLELKVNFMGAISAFLLYYYLFKSFLKVDEKKEISEINRFFWENIYILSVPILYFTGIRYCVGFIFYLYGIVLSEYTKENKKGIIYMLLAVVSHFGLFIPVIIFIFYKIFFKKINILYLKVYVLIAFILGKLNLNMLLIKIIDFIHFILGKNIFNKNAYIIGEWGAEFIEFKLKNANLFGIIQEFGRIYIEQVIIIIYIFFIYSKNKMLKKLIICLSIVCFLLQNYYAPLERYQMIVFFLILMDLTENFKKNRWKKILYYLVILRILIIQIFIFKNYYNSFLISYGDFLKISLFNIFL